MRRIFLLALAVVMTIGAQAQTPQAQAFPSFVEVNGVAEREVEPDRIYLTITINERESKGRITVEKQEQDMIVALRKLGIDTKEQLRVNDISSSRLKRTQAVTTKSYQLLLTEPTLVSEVIATLQEAGITAIGIEKAFYINYYQSSQPAVFRMMKANVVMTEEAADGAVPTVEQPEFRKIKLSATVQAKFVLE